MAGPIEYDALLLSVAGRNGGICRRSDLLAIGLSESAIDRRRRLGFLETVTRGVYQVPALSESSTPLHRAIVTLAGSTLSHITAGMLNDFSVEPVDPRNRVDVIVPDNSGQKLSGVVIHRRRRPPVGCDVQTLDGLPITAPARTIVDLASVVGPSRRHIVQTQVGKDRPTPEQLTACFDAGHRSSRLGPSNTAPHGNGSGAVGRCRGPNVAASPRGVIGVGWPAPPGADPSSTPRHSILRV